MTEPHEVTVNVTYYRSGIGVGWRAEDPCQKKTISTEAQWKLAEHDRRIARSARRCAPALVSAHPRASSPIGPGRANECGQVDTVEVIRVLR